MNKAICYVGVDVGKSELVVAWAGHRPRTFANTASGVRSLVQRCRRIAGDRIVHVCMEATGVYSQVLALRLHAQGDATWRISIVNPAQIHFFGRALLQRTKTDPVDARTILAFAQSRSLPLWQPDAPALRELLELVCEVEAVQKSLQAWSNRTSTHTDGQVQSRLVRRTDREMVRTLTRQLARLEAAVADVCARDEHLRRQSALIRSIPGVGEKTAPCLLAYGKSTWLTHSEKELTAYAGLAPHHHLSGTSVRGKSYLAKQGNNGLRRALFYATLTAIRHIPSLRAIRDRLVNKGKPKMVAIAACMRHLLLIVRAVLRNQRPFDPNYQAKTA